MDSNDSSKDYISVSEFAKIKKISKQRVYQLLNKELNRFVQEVDGKKMLKSSAIQEYKSEESGQKIVQETVKDSNAALIDTLNETIQILRGQLEIKDRQIETLNQLLNQQQILQRQQLQLAEKNEQKERKGFLSLFRKDKTEDE